MTYKLLYVNDDSLSATNIGDYIQALAAAQFLPSVSGFIDREKLKDYTGEDCKVIMNGWYIHNTEQWPPSSKIHPLFISVHFNSTAIHKLLSKESLCYLKQHEPIGCRDEQTKDLLIANGINAYFSGCLTLTLGHKYMARSRTNQIYFVDAYFISHWNIRTVIKNALYLLFNYSAISIISKKHPEPKKGIRKKMILTTFYREYRKFFSKETLINANYISQQSNYYKDCFNSEEERLAEAERLVKLYSEAQLVVTSRIHCALPCLGLNTPVIYVEDSQQSNASACRFGGIKDFFNILSWDRDHLVSKFKFESPITNIKNKEIHSIYVEKLRSACMNWINDNN